MNNIILCFGAAGVYFGAIVLRGVFGYLKNKKIAIEELSFEWKRFLKGSIKPVLLTLAIGSLASLLVAFAKLVDESGIPVYGMEHISVENIILGLFIADLGALAYAIEEAFLAFGLTEKQIRQIRDAVATVKEDEKTSAKLDYKDGQYLVEVENVKQDDGSAKTYTKKEVAQMGAWPYYKVDVSTPTAFYNAVNGRGFDEGYGKQCVAGFKEFTFSLCGKVVATATGGASGYANQRAQIEALGFTYIQNVYDLKDGDWVIFGGGKYGHVAMRYNGRFFGQNQGAASASAGNAFNLMALNLNNYLCHYRPNIYKEAPKPEVKPEVKPTPKPAPKKSNETIANEVIKGKWGNGKERVDRLTEAGYNYNDIQTIVNSKVSKAPKTECEKVSYTYKKGDTFGAVILKLGLSSGRGLWGDDGDVAYYTQQLKAQGIDGNIPVGKTITLTRR